MNFSFNGQTPGLPFNLITVPYGDTQTYNVVVTVIPSSQCLNFQNSWLFESSSLCQPVMPIQYPQIADAPILPNPSSQP